MPDARAADHGVAESDVHEKAAEDYALHGARRSFATRSRRCQVRRTTSTDCEESLGDSCQGEGLHTFIHTHLLRVRLR